MLSLVNPSVLLVCTFELLLRISLSINKTVHNVSSQVGNFFELSVDTMQIAAFHALLIDGVWLPIYGW